MDEQNKLQGVYGGQVKAIEGDMDSDEMVVSGPGVVFSDDSDGNPVRDLAGEYFTKDTYFGHRKGDGVDAMFNHGLPLLHKARGWFCTNGNQELIIPDNLYKFFGKLAEHRFTNPVKAEMSEDESHLAATLILNLRNEYEKWVAQRVRKGLLSWSSGSTRHMAKMDWNSRKILRWPIAEFSLTPTPAEPRTTISGKSVGFDSALNFFTKSGMFDQSILTELLKLESQEPEVEESNISLYDELSIKQELQRLREFSETF